MGEDFFLLFVGDPESLWGWTFRRSEICDKVPQVGILILCAKRRGWTLVSEKIFGQIAKPLVSKKNLASLGDKHFLTT